MADIDFEITLENFQQGFAPVAHLDNKTFLGNEGQASEMMADVLSKPGFLTQSPALADLTNGNQAGVVDQLIRHILDKPTAADTTFAVGTTKLFKLTSTSVVSGGSPSWPQVITDMTEGECVIRMKTNLFVFYNKASGGDIAAMPLSTEVIDPDWGSATDQALEKALHPAAANEDVILFGNGQYIGAYVVNNNELDTRKVDFGEGAEVADIIYHANQWWIAVNHGEGKGSRIYLYDASAVSHVWYDSLAVGDQRIGFLYLLNGIIYVCYQELSSGGHTVGYLSGSQMIPLRYFAGSLPDHRQKTLYKNTILFLSSGDVFSVGAVIQQLPNQVSRLADGGYATVGGIAAPFGVPLIASSDGSSNHRLAQFSGYTTNSEWKSRCIDVSNGRKLGHVSIVIISTKPLAANARCDIRLEGNQGTVIPLKEDGVTPWSLEVSGENKMRHVHTSIALPIAEDIRVVVDWEEGNGVSDCPIRKIYIAGNYVDR